MNEKEARKRVRKIKGFYTNLIVYVVVNAGLLLINWITSPNYWWFYWVTLFWGLGLVLHAIRIFTSVSSVGNNWEEKEVKKMMNKK